MATAILNAKGQITVPVAVRNELQLSSGDQVEFVQIAHGRYEMIAKTVDVKDLKGMFGIAKKSVSIEKMNQARRGLHRNHDKWCFIDASAAGHTTWPLILSNDTADAYN
jgi:AbrB family looped-hinge helix DNA binding protein